MEFLSKNDLDALWIKIKGTFGMSLDVSGSNMRLLGKEIVSNSWQDKVLASVSQATARTWLGWNEKMEASARGTTVASLENGKIPLAQIPDVVLGQMLFGGTVNASGVATLTANVKSKLGITDNTVQLVNAAGTSSTYGWVRFEGVYFIMSAASDFASLDLQVGDWLISTGTQWSKIDNTDAVTSVCGYTGAVTASQISGALQLGTAATHAHTDYVTGITFDSTSLKLKQSKGGGTATDIVQFGSNAFNSTAYLPLAGGDVDYLGVGGSSSMPLTVIGTAAEGAGILFTDSTQPIGAIGVTPAGVLQYVVNDNPYDIIHSGNISSQSVNHAASADSATTCTGNAATASKLNTDAGSASQPVYFSNGVPVACSTSLTDYLPLTGGAVDYATVGDGQSPLPLTISGQEGSVGGAGVIFSIPREGTTPLNYSLGVIPGGSLVFGVQGGTNYNVIDSNNYSTYINLSSLGAAAASHTHGNIQNGGTLQTNDVAIANGDKLVITDSSDSSKIARASLTFDGSTATQALTKAGSWQSFLRSDLGGTVSGPVTIQDVTDGNPLTLVGKPGDSGVVGLAFKVGTQAGDVTGGFFMTNNGRISVLESGYGYGILHTGNSSLEHTQDSQLRTIGCEFKINNTTFTIGEIGSAYINSLS